MTQPKKATRHLLYTFWGTDLPGFNHPNRSHDDNN